MRYAILRVHRFARSDVQPSAVWPTPNNGVTTMQRAYSLAIAIVLAGVFGLIGSASAKH
jgi:hypothetical protein